MSRTPQVPAMDRFSVCRDLGLDDEYEGWLESLEAVGPPPVPLRLPRGAGAVDQLSRLGVVEPELSEIVAALPNAGGDPALWWLLERSHHQVLRRIGAGPVGDRDVPSLPKALGISGRCFWIFVYLSALDEIRRYHLRRGIPDAISWATLADLGGHVTVHRRRVGKTGFDAQSWLSGHFSGALYALGRLQFIPDRRFPGAHEEAVWNGADDGVHLPPAFLVGDTVLGVHIPEGGPLTPAACDESFAMAPEFFARYFPELDLKPLIATCSSWLLDDQLADLLPATSNIVRFQRRFHMVPGAWDEDAEIFRFVFDRTDVALDDVVATTTLERAVVSHLRAGGHWRVRHGWLEL